MINLGTIQKNLGNYDSALYYYNKTLTLDTTQSDSKFAYIKFRKAQVYTKLKEMDEALNFALESLETYSRIDSKIGLVLAASALTKIYYELGQEGKCIEMAAKCLEWSSQINHYPEETQEVCKILIDLFQKNKQFEKAHYYQKLYATLRAKFFSPTINIKMHNERLKLETKAIELEKTLLLEKQNEKEKEIQTQRSIILVSIAGLLLSISLFIFMIRQSKTIGMLNRKLKQTNEEVSRQSNDLIASNEEIEAINTNLEHLVHNRTEKIIEQNKKLTEYAFYNAHKVRGPLARILGLISLMEIEIKNDSLLQVISSLKTAGHIMDNHIRELNIILESSDSTPDT
jgi:tetratricopeptide (TPR) repeat protein